MASQFPLKQINPNPTTDRKIYTHNGLSPAGSVPTDLPYFPSSSNAMTGNSNPRVNILPPLSTSNKKSRPTQMCRERQAHT
jgi:hypothetical protein